jgi:hypothetical protein
VRRNIAGAFVICLGATLWPVSPAATSAAGPENGGLRLRLAVEPLRSMKDEGFDVRLALVNVSRREVEIHAAWEPGENGSARDYLIAATRFECFPPLPPVTGATSAALREEEVKPQPKLALAPGDELVLQWQTKGRRLKNATPSTGIGDAVDFPLPGLYAVHAILDIETSAGILRLRSNEQLVPAGGSDAAPRHTYVPVKRAVPAESRAVIGAGALHGIQVGDRFESMTKQVSWRLTVVDVSPRYADAKLELLSTGDGVDAPPEHPEFATLVLEDEEQPK